ncbi:MAG: class I SAM-dependent methyltransferase [Phycisphaerae bacterium]|nr:class I SAM-dependent methyltransferase [Phycisphaerae bacterium]
MDRTPDEILSMEREDWDRNAAFYRSDERSPLMRVLASRRASFYALRPGQRVLDLGCGVGGTVAGLRALGVDAVGVDFSPAMIEAAIRQHGLEGYVRCAEAGDLPFHTDSFDVVIADGLFHHLAVQGRLPEAIGEIRRVLRVGGKLCCFDRNGTLVSGLLLRMCIWGKELIRIVTRRPLYSSSATRNEIPFGGRRDLEVLRSHGLEVSRRRNVASAPFFLSVVALNVVQYFLSKGLRDPLERKISGLLAWIDECCDWSWLCVEQMIVFEARPRGVVGRVPPATPS